MSSLRISPDLFLGSQELNKWQKFLQDEGYKKLLLEDSISFGIVHKDIVDGNWTNFLVQQGTNSGTIKINEGIAINKDCNMIRFATRDNIAVADDNTWKWIKVSYQTTNVETGTVSIAQNGSLSGVGTKFTETLRGGPNNASRISFPNSSSNIYEYDVLEVISDTEVILMGDFSAESNISYACVGSFTPDTITPSGSKYPFQYDSCIVTLVNESILNTPPTLIDGEEFLIARIRRIGSTLNIEDKRSLNIYRSKASTELNKMSIPNNPLIGIESVRFSRNITPRYENLVDVAWNFRSTNWSISTSDNRLTIIGGLGGKYKSVNDFVDGDFNGWRVYISNFDISPDNYHGYSIVKNSFATGGQINLILDTLNPSLYSLTNEILICPDADEIELVFTPNPADVGGITDRTRREVFPVNTPFARVPLVVYKNVNCPYFVNYRYRNFGVYTGLKAIPTDEVNGYYVETDFDDNGALIASVRETYTANIVYLQQANNSYTNVINTISSGNLLGYQYTALDNAVPKRDFIAGTDLSNIIITQEIGSELDQTSDPDFGSPYNLTVDHFLNFPDDQPGTIRNGQEFLIQVRGTYVPGAFKLRLVSGYVSPGNFGRLLYEFTASDFDYAADDNLLIKVFFDGIFWTAYPMRHVKATSIGWANITLANGWTAFGSSTPQYKIDASGFVHLRGKLQASGSSSGNVTGNLAVPSPPQDVSFVTPPLSNAIADGIMLVAINSSGRIAIPTDYYSTSMQYRLDGITYATEAF